MKKSLLALAVLGAFAGAASAQSSVTLYGLVDMGVARINNGTSNGVLNGAPAKPDVNTIQQGASSRLGFRGVEDLGGGVKAAFQIEHRFFPDSGEINNPFWNARSTVSLSSAAGSIYLGREYVPAFWVALAGDPWGWDTIGQFSSTYTWAGYRSGDSQGGVTNASSIRNGNTVGLKTANMGGFTAELAVSASEANRGAYGKSIGFNAQYANGPLYFGLGYDQTKNNGAAGTVDPRLVVATAKVTFGPVTPSINVAQSRSAADLKTSAVTLAATINVGASGQIRVASGASVAKTSNTGATADIKSNKVALGYMHGLSKRTFIYGDIASAKRDGQSAPGVDYTRSTGFDLGVKHSF